MESQHLSASADSASLSRDEMHFCSRMAKDTASVLVKNLRQMSSQNGSTTREHASAFCHAFVDSLRREFDRQMGFPSERRNGDPSSPPPPLPHSSKRFSLRRTNRRSTNDGDFGGGGGGNVLKEGQLRQLIDGGGSTPEWAPCRVVLIQRPRDGHMLEFYNKGSKPKSGIYCFLIGEVRRTKSVELDVPNTFVVKAQGFEYILEATSSKETESWLSAIRRSVDSASMATIGSGGSSGGSSPVLSRRGIESSLSPPAMITEKERFSLSETPPPPPPMEGAPPLPPPPPPPHPDERPWSTSSPTRTSVISDEEKRSSGGSWVFPPPAPVAQSLYESRVNPDHPLAKYPWFHGSLSRADAAILVLEDGLQHGTWLLRQSETRGGDYVLTFNHVGRAKHLRMSVSPDMRCKVQHLQFDSIVEMLENFKRHPIPLEVGNNADVVLGNYVTAAPTVFPPPPPPFPSASLLERKDSEKEALGWGGLFVSLPPKGRQQQVPQRGFREGRSQSMSASLTSNHHHHHHTGSRAHNNLYSVM